MTVALFGGSFNPPHVAHVLAAMTVQLLHPISTVLIMPAYRHPFEKDLASYEERVAMCERAFHGLPHTKVSRLEQELDLDGRTLSTVRALKERLGDVAMRLVIGSDILLETRKWYRFDELAALAPPLILARNGVDGLPSQRALLPELSSTEVRALIRDGQWDRAAELVPQAVLRYIRERDLYRS